jgi:hypothetical protein
MVIPREISRKEETDMNSQQRSVMLDNVRRSINDAERQISIEHREKLEAEEKAFITNLGVDEHIAVLRKAGVELRHGVVEVVKPASDRWFELKDEICEGVNAKQAALETLYHDTELKLVMEQDADIAMDILAGIRKQIAEIMAAK